MEQNWKTLSKEKKAEILARCFKMVDHLSEMATKNILNLIDSNTCPMADQLLRNSPEIIALKAFEQAIGDIKMAFRRPNVELN